MLFLRLNRQPFGVNVRLQTQDNLQFRKPPDGESFMPPSLNASIIDAAPVGISFSHLRMNMGHLQGENSACACARARNHHLEFGRHS